MSVPVGAVAPQSVRLRVSAGLTGLDMTTVTTVSLSVRKPNGRKVTWSPTIDPATPATTGLLSLIYTFAGGDVSMAGAYRLKLALTFPAGVRYARAYNLIAEKD